MSTRRGRKIEALRVPRVLIKEADYLGDKAQTRFRPYWEDEKDWLGTVGRFVCEYYCVDLFSSMASIHSWRVRSSRSGLPSCQRSSF